MSPLLTVENLGKTFRQADGSELHVLANINLVLNPGEIVCLLGASGSGKTTLLQILAGLEDCDSGAIHSAVKRPGPQLGYLTQNDELLPWRTALANAALGLEVLGRPKNEAKDTAHKYLQQAGLANFANAYPAQLSGGMRQRVLLARMLATQPTLLLLDEPMSNLDILARRQMADLVKTYVRATNAAALIVTHSVEEACFLADRILLITRMPAVIYKEINENITMDGVMGTLLQTLEGIRV